MVDFKTQARYIGSLDTSDLPRKRIGVPYRTPDGGQRCSICTTPHRETAHFRSL